MNWQPWQSHFGVLHLTSGEHFDIPNVMLLETAPDEVRVRDWKGRFRAPPGFTPDIASDWRYTLALDDGRRGHILLSKIEYAEGKIDVEFDGTGPLAQT